MATQDARIAHSARNGRPGDAVIENLRSLQETAREQTTDELKAELSRLLAFTTDNLLMMAVVVAELESRGEDLSHIKSGLLKILRDIACGNVLPDIVVMFAGEPTKLKMAAHLPIVEQHKVLAGKRPVNLPPRPIRNRKSWDPEEVKLDVIHEIVTRPNLEQLARNATAKDVADMAAELVLKSIDPTTAARRLVERLTRERLL